VTYFAFSFPFSFEESFEQMDVFEKRLKGLANVYFHREVLYYSLEGRKMEMVTISSNDGLAVDENG